MDRADGECSVTTRQRRRRQAKQRNEAFRRRLSERKADRRQAIQLRLATAVAAVSWAVAGFQLMR